MTNDLTDSEPGVKGAFGRLERLIGADGLARLANAHVAVIGLGAVGSFAVEALARTGVGHLRLVDFDTVGPSNLNRQLLALESTLGRPKVDVAAERVRDINPACVVDARSAFFSAEEADALLAPPLDFVIDAIDALNPKIQLIEYAVRHDLHLVSAMGAANRTDPTRVRLSDISETRYCPLARRVRKRLRRLSIHRGVTVVWSIEPPHAPTVPLDQAQPGEEEKGCERGRDRVIQPSMCALPGIFGLTAASHTIDHLLKQ